MKVTGEGEGTRQPSPATLERARSAALRFARRVNPRFEGNLPAGQRFEVYYCPLAKACCGRVDAKSLITWDLGCRFEYVILPHWVARFVNYFDRGLYPELDSAAKNVP